MKALESILDQTIRKTDKTVDSANIAQLISDITPHYTNINGEVSYSRGVLYARDLRGDISQYFNITNLRKIRTIHIDEWNLNDPLDLEGGRNFPKEIRATAGNMNIYNGASTSMKDITLIGKEHVHISSSAITLKNVQVKTELFRLIVSDPKNIKLDNIYGNTIHTTFAIKDTKLFNKFIEPLFKDGEFIEDINPYKMFGISPRLSFASFNIINEDESLKEGIFRITISYDLGREKFLHPDSGWVRRGNVHCAYFNVENRTWMKT